ncbi:hypothetical protein F5Y12DRAFT_791804 [Xylaria sp. FL1777]|nr:hypothetical protein F5Y12DRAFT_791804 [Xylaria sp. FL1777]
MPASMRNTASGPRATAANATAGDDPLVTMREMHEMHEMLDKMSEGIMEGINTMKTDVNTMKTDVNTMKTDVNTMKTDVNTMKTDVEALQTDVNTIKTNIKALQNGQGNLYDDFQARNHHQQVSRDTDYLCPRMNYHTGEIVLLPTTIRHFKQLEVSSLDALATKLGQNTPDYRGLEKPEKQRYLLEFIGVPSLEATILLLDPTNSPVAASAA